MSPSSPEDFVLPAVEPSKDDALIQHIALAILNEWNAAYSLNRDVMTQAGESFKRRFYAEVAVNVLRRRGWRAPGE